MGIILLLLIKCNCWGTAFYWSMVNTMEFFHEKSRLNCSNVNIIFTRRFAGGGGAHLFKRPSISNCILV